MSVHHIGARDKVMGFGWVERSDTHHISIAARQRDGFRECSTHPSRYPAAASAISWNERSRVG